MNQKCLLPSENVDLCDVGCSDAVTIQVRQVLRLSMGLLKRRKRRGRSDPNPLAISILTSDLLNGKIIIRLPPGNFKKEGID